MARPHAVVIGAGIGGLAAAAGLHAAGWEATICERAPALDRGGAGLALAPNGLRALDVIGVGEAVRVHAVPQEIGIRSPGGRWLLRSTTGDMVTARFGDPVILLPRAQVIDALLTRVPEQAFAFSTEVTSVRPGGPGTARIVTTAGELDAELVVAADGIGSATRNALFPRHPGLRYAGFTTWRLLAGGQPEAIPVALASYTATRLPRTTDVVRWSHRAASMTTWTARPAVAARNTMAGLLGKLAPGALLRTLIRLAAGATGGQKLPQGPPEQWT
jgi:2-polyprenyl-6-methoxyphenol hydroxylase-like FAD-dependent oxidoreductase